MHKFQIILKKKKNHSLWTQARQYLKLHHSCKIAGFHYSATEVFSTLIYCKAQIGSWLPTTTYQTTPRNIPATPMFHTSRQFPTHYFPNANMVKFINKLITLWRHTCTGPYQYLNIMFYMPLCITSCDALQFCYRAAKLYLLVHGWDILQHSVLYRTMKWAKLISTTVLQVNVMCV